MDWLNWLQSAIGLGGTAASLFQTGDDAYGHLRNDLYSNRQTESDVAERLMSGLVANDPSTQRNLQQFDQFANPAIDRFLPNYNTASGRFNEGDKYDENTLKAALNQRMRDAIDQQYTNVDRDITTDALRTHSTNAGEILKRLQDQRGTEYRKAATDATIAAPQIAEQLNAQRRNTATAGLQTAQSPLSTASGQRTAGAAGLLGGSQDRITNSINNMFATNRDAFGNVQRGLTSAATGRGTNSGNDAAAAGLGGAAVLNGGLNLFNRVTNAGRTPQFSTPSYENPY